MTKQYRVSNWIMDRFMSNAVNRRIAEASNEAFSLDEPGYRRLTDRADKDINTMTQDRMIRLALMLHRQNPLAKRIVDIKADYVVGSGFEIIAEDPYVQSEIIDPFVEANLEDNYYQMAVELGLYGEQYFPAYTNSITGQVKLGIIDPDWINRIETHPDNILDRVAVTLRAALGEKAKTFQIIRPGMDLTDDTFVAPTFMWTLNNVRTATRGLSDLLPLFDWLDAYDQTLFSELERISYGKAWFWDVTLEGKDEAYAKKWLKGRTQPPVGGIMAHSQEETWKIQSPDLKTQEQNATTRMVKNQILGGAGYPEHWFAFGGDANRATAIEMGGPTLKSMETRQNFFKNMIRYMVRYAVDRGVDAGVVPANSDISFKVNAPEMDRKDLVKITSSLASLSGSLAIAVMNGYIKVPAASKIYAQVVEYLGYELEAEDLGDGSDPDYATHNIPAPPQVTA
ncbi:hypothetical protein HQ531_03520 [bacterium]|nr:hypothetical protein [bacterium]